MLAIRFVRLQLSYHTVSFLWVRMKILKGQFSPTWFMTLLAMTLFILFIALGRWQLERADLKRDIQNRFVEQLQQPYKHMVLESERDDSFAYRKIKLKGYYRTDQSILIDNRVHKGHAGYHILQPFFIDNTQRAVLVNRGWVAADYDRAILPDIKPPVVADQVEGVVTIPSTGGFRMGAVEITGSWPQRLPYIDLQKIQQGIKYELLPYVIWLSPDVQDYYVREWKPVWSSPEKSEAYATQWFSFAGIIFILYVALNFSKTSIRKQHD
jgi:surfeit locus 1 family protein